MCKVKKAKFSGIFYPHTKDELLREVNSYRTTVEQNVLGDPVGIIVPHAGYFYSGACSAYGYQAIAQKKFKTAIIISPSHKFNFFDFSVGAYKAYETPLGLINVNNQFVNLLLEDDKFDFHQEAHETEHSLEVQLPFLQALDKQIEIVPIIFGDQNFANSKYLAELLYNLISDRLDDFVIIISSDLSHYHSSERAQILDYKIMGDIEDLQIDKLQEDYFQHRIEACGIGGICTIMYIAEKLGLKIKHLNYAHSGEKSGDMNQVVGYLSSLIYR